MKGIMEWCGFYKTYDFLAEFLQNKSVFVEIGVLYGNSLIYLLKKLKKLNKKVLCYGVDLWDYNGEEEYLEDIFKEGHTVYEDFISNLKEADVFDYVIPIKADSSSYAKFMKDESIDAIFFDGNHNRGFRNDLIAWIPKVKIGGFIGGDDYLHKDSPLVKQYVDEFFGDKVQLMDTTQEHKAWWLIKE